MVLGATARIKKREVMWRRIVAGHAGSGMSIRAYCAKNRVREPAFYWWRAQLAQREAAKPKSNAAPKPAAAFMPVVVGMPPASDPVEGITIEWRGGRVLRLPAMAVGQVAELVRAIEGGAVTPAGGAA